MTPGCISYKGTNSLILSHHNEDWFQRGILRRQEWCEFIRSWPRPFERRDENKRKRTAWLIGRLQSNEDNSQIIHRALLQMQQTNLLCITANIYEFTEVFSPLWRFYNLKITEGHSCSGRGVKTSFMPVLFSLAQVLWVPISTLNSRKMSMTHNIYFLPSCSNHCLKWDLSTFLSGDWSPSKSAFYFSDFHRKELF